MIISTNTTKKIHNSKDIYNIVKVLLNARQETEQHKEYFYTFYLDSQNNIICIDLSSFGTINHCFPIIREILRLALLKDAVSMIICHNHPSGTLTASIQDMKFTKELETASKLFDIKLLDHLIIGKDDYLSMSDDMLF